MPAHWPDDKQRRSHRSSAERDSVRVGKSNMTAQGRNQARAVHVTWYHSAGEGDAKIIAKYGLAGHKSSWHRWHYSGPRQVEYLCTAQPLYRGESCSDGTGGKGRRRAEGGKVELAEREKGRWRSHQRTRPALGPTTIISSMMNELLRMPPVPLRHIRSSRSTVAKINPDGGGA